MKNYLAIKQTLEMRIRLEHGFTLTYVEYCENSRTPGLLGSIRGVTDWENREVRISTQVNRRAEDMIETLKHELRHLDEPEWDCGNRDVFGRGPRKMVSNP
jgi:hypothetical protein